MIEDKEVGELWRDPRGSIRAVILKLVEERARLIALENVVHCSVEPSNGDRRQARLELGLRWP